MKCLQYAIKCFLFVLFRVSELSERNKMTVDNIALLLGPLIVSCVRNTLLHSQLTKLQKKKSSVEECI